MADARKAPLRAFLRGNPFPHPYTEGFFYREKMRAIHRVAPDGGVEEILEVGGGRSGLARTLYPGARVTTLDLDPAYAESELNRGERVRFVQGDATDLPFPDHAFDAVTLFDVLEHIPDDAAAAREALRVLRPGGHVLVSTPHVRWRYPYFRALRPICPPERELWERWGHVRRGYALSELEALVGGPAEASAAFITPATELGHDLAFSRLRPRLRRAACAAVSPLTWAGYWLQRPGTPGSELAARWRKSGASASRHSASPDP